MRQKQQLPHWLSEISPDKRADPVSGRQRQSLPQLDEQALREVERVVLGHALAPDLLETMRIDQVERIAESNPFDSRFDRPRQQKWYQGHSDFRQHWVARVQYLGTLALLLARRGNRAC